MARAGMVTRLQTLWVTAQESGWFAPTRLTARLGLLAGLTLWLDVRGAAGLALSFSRTPPIGNACAAEASRRCRNDARARRPRWPGGRPGVRVQSLFLLEV